MKRMMIILLILLTMTGCMKKEETEVLPEPVAEENGTPLTDAYLDQLDGYEDLEVAYLGTISKERSLDDIRSRAIQEWGLEFIKEIDDSHIIHGPQTAENMVYLLIPNRNSDLRIASYEDDEVICEEENCPPVLYIESNAIMDILSTISVVRHLENGVSENFFPTGLDVCSGQLRTDFHMGVVDISHYEDFDHTEIPFYDQFLFDRLYYDAPLVSDDLQSGSYDANPLWEIEQDGHRYLVYEIGGTQEGIKSYFYAIHYDSEQNEFRYLISTDQSQWNNPGGE